MAKKRSRRQRLKRDPANRPLAQVVAWAKKEGIRQIGLKTGLLALPRLTAFAAGHAAVDRVLRRRKKYADHCRAREAAYAQYLTFGDPHV